jgi:four helix bundle protein
VPVRSYRDLRVWQISIDFAEDLYRITLLFPREEVYSLTAQIRRAVSSIPLNIAEGHARQSTREFLHSLSIAAGSLAEVETQLILAARLKYLEQARLDELLLKSDEIGKMIRGCGNRFRHESIPGPPNPWSLAPSP